MPALFALALLLPVAGRVEGQVVARALEVFDAPTDAAFPTDRVARGDRLVVVRRGPEEGWLAVRPPPGALSWIDREAIEDEDGGRARVVVSRATVRSGAEGARLPGAATVTLRQGAEVQLLDRPPLALRQGRATRTLVAIAPPDGEVRYVRALGVRLQGAIADAPDVGPDPIGAPALRRAAGAGGMRVRVDRRLVGVGPVGDESALPAELRAGLGAIEEEHRGVLRRPVEQWRLGPIRRRYEELLRSHPEPAAREALRARLDRVERQEAFARASAAFESLLRQSRARGRVLDGPPAEEADRDDTAPYDAEGLLQPTIREVEGQRVFALIGKTGETTAYLRLPAGLDGQRLAYRRVGVRGKVQFDESLRARLISVQDLEPIGRAP
jgi:hypothetical protein